jgi:hypothetical protein
MVSDACGAARFLELCADQAPQSLLSMALRPGRGYHTHPQGPRSLARHERTQARGKATVWRLARNFDATVCARQRAP